MSPSYLTYKRPVSPSPSRSFQLCLRTETQAGASFLNLESRAYSLGEAPEMETSGHLALICPSANECHCRDPIKASLLVALSQQVTRAISPEPRHPFV